MTKSVKRSWVRLWPALTVGAVLVVLSLARPNPNTDGASRREARLHWRMDERRAQLEALFVGVFAGECKGFGSFVTVSVKPESRGVVATIQCANRTLLVRSPASRQLIAEMRSVWQEGHGAGEVR